MAFSYAAVIAGFWYLVDTASARTTQGAATLSLWVAVLALCLALLRMVLHLMRRRKMR
jgi:hypothetical protein